MGDDQAARNAQQINSIKKNRLHVTKGSDKRECHLTNVSFHSLLFLSPYRGASGA